MPQEHIVATEFDGGEGMLVDLNTKQYHQMNETAMLVWRHLEQGHSVEEIVNELTARYAVTPEHARASVERLLGELRARGLI